MSQSEKTKEKKGVEICTPFHILVIRMTVLCIAGERLTSIECRYVCVSWEFLPFSDSITNADLVVVRCSSVDVTVASLEHVFSGRSYLTC